MVVGGFFDLGLGCELLFGLVHVCGLFLRVDSFRVVLVLCLFLILFV